VARPTAEIVTKWIRAYPQYADDIQAHAAEMLDMDSRADIPVADMTHREAEARSAALNAVYRAGKERAAVQPRFSSLREAATLAGTSLREIADGIDLARAVVSDVDSHAIIESTIPKKFARAIAPKVNQSVDDLWVVIVSGQRPGSSAMRIEFKSIGPPTSGRQRTWKEAIEASNMTPDRKLFWLSEDG
jgi:hypothetical protein